MKHTEPLQGMKLMQGHLVMHVSMFIASFFINTVYYEDEDWTDVQSNDEMDDPLRYKRRLVRYWSYLAFLWIGWSHGLSACLQILSVSLKVKRQFLTQKYVQIFQMFLYQFPMLYIQWIVYTNLTLISSGELNAVRDTQ